jgi:serine/threonine protein kinase
MIEEELFHRALQKPTLAEQLAFLDEVCADQPELRQRVERLLRSHRHEDSFLHPGVTADQSPSESPATVIGPYKLIEPLGEGGMGTVWMAQQQEPVKRLVALKLIKAGMDSKQIIARFEAERQALALMEHANIARVLDAGRTGAGRPYFVMDLVKGVPITKYCDEHRFTPRQRLELFIPVCQAVQHAHQKGIIHRDLKPSNVLVALYDGKAVPKVIDFGVAKAAGSSLTDKTLVTGFGNIVGTLEYMSPEQAEINQLDIDTRSDIYSLGVLLYELLTGSPPFGRKELDKGGVLEMLRVIREQEPTKPSTKLSTAEGLPTLAANRGTEPAKLTRLVRGELDWIVMKALEKDRNRRYETANGFAMDVQRYLADEPVQACPPSAGYRLRKFARRHRVGLGMAAALTLVLLLAAGSVGWLWRQQSAQQATRRAETERAVNLALGRTDQLRDQAATMPTATSVQADAALVVWRRAEDTLAQAEAALSTGTADEDLRQRVGDMDAQVERGKQQTEQVRARIGRKEKLFRDLDEARLAASVWIENRFDDAGAAKNTRRRSRPTTWTWRLGAAASWRDGFRQRNRRCATP